MSEVMRRQWLPVIAGISLIAVLTIATGLLVAIFTDSDPSQVSAQTVASGIAQRLEGGCPDSGPKVGRGDTSTATGSGDSFDSPVRAQIVGQDGTVCRGVLGSDFPPDAAQAQESIRGSSDTLQVRIESEAASGSNGLIIFLCAAGGTMLTALAAAAVALRLTSPSIGGSEQRRRRAARREHHTIAPTAGHPTDYQTSPSTTGGPDYGQPHPVATPQPTAAAAQPPHRSTQASARKQKTSGVKSARPAALPRQTLSGTSGLTVDRGTSADFDVYAATQVGRSHAKVGQTREDAYALSCDPRTGWTFMAVADGLGSTRDAHAAARVATQQVLAHLSRMHLPLDSPRPEHDWATAAASVIEEVAKSVSPRIAQSVAAWIGYVPAEEPRHKRSAAACTLAFAAIGPLASDATYPLFWGCVGDCDVLTIDVESSALTWITDTETKQAGGLVSNTTAALPHDTSALRTGCTNTPRSTMTVLATDGMADAIRDETPQMADLLSRIASVAPDECYFGEIVSFDLPGLVDDRTIAAIWPRRPDEVAQSGQ